MRRSSVAGAICGAGAGGLLAQSTVLAASPDRTGHLLPAPLSVLADPTLAFGLLLLALLGVGLEAMHPGAVVPGTVGLLSGVLAVAALLDLSLNLLGLVLVAVAAGLFVLDLGAQSHGVLSVAGMAAAAAGGWLLFRGPGVDPVALVALPVALGAIWLWLSARAMAVRRRAYPAVPQELLGHCGLVVEPRDGGAVARVDGELWRVVERSDHPLSAGDEVEVLAQDGLTLIVRQTAAGGSAEPSPDRRLGAEATSSHRSGT